MNKSTDYAAIHRLQPGFGKTGLRLLPYIQSLIEDCQAKHLLDFGCGKGVLGKKLQSRGYAVRLYDPFIPDYAEPPLNSFDMVLCTDVMEHIPVADLDEVLTTIRARSEKVVFVISLTFADQLLQDGSNAHCTIQSEDWWRAQLSKHFTTIEKVPTRQKTAVCFVTWSPKMFTLSRLRWRKGLQHTHERVMQMLSWPFRQVAASWIERRGSADLREFVQGKNVALVGNGRSLLQRSDGASIDAQQVVIRLNRGPIINPEVSGRRTTILASSISVTPGLLRQRGIELLMWMTPKRSAFPLWLLRPKWRGFVFRRSDYRRLKSLLGARPSTGIMTIDALIACEPARVMLFGFDGFLSGSMSELRRRESYPHDFAAELKLIQSWAEAGKPIAWPPSS